MNKQAFMNIAKGVKRALRKHSPEILTGIGIAGMIATTVTAVRATPKALQLIDAREIKEEKRLSMDGGTWWMRANPNIIVGETLNVKKVIFNGPKPS